MVPATMSKSCLQNDKEKPSGVHEDVVCAHAYVCMYM